MADEHTARRLSEDEERLLHHLLAVDDPRLEPLRQQVPRTLVSKDVDWPRWIEFVVSMDAPPAKDVYRNPVVEAHTLNEDEHMLTVTLWIDGDYLDRIEVSWYDSEPQRLPRPDELQPAHLFGS